MIEVLLHSSPEGYLQSCKAQGHANYGPKGQDIVCAAFSCLLRTVLAQLESRPSIVLNTELPDRGMLAFSVQEFSKDDESLLKYCLDFLKTGIEQLVSDYPEHIKLRVK